MTTDCSLQFDHIALVARSLDEGAAYIKDVLGIEMPNGGAHPRMGTHNRLMSLGGEAYLEVIAIDPDAPVPDRPRWYDLDRFDDSPRLGTWVLGTRDIESALTHAHPNSGRAIEMARGDLGWLISVPDEGSMPMDGAFPTLIEWPVDPHPATNMIDLGCRLASVSIEHPQAEVIENLIGDRIDRGLIEFSKKPQMRIKAIIDTPTGLKELI